MGSKGGGFLLRKDPGRYGPSLLETLWIISMIYSNIPHPSSIEGRAIFRFSPILQRRLPDPEELFKAVRRSDWGMIHCREEGKREGGFERAIVFFWRGV